MSSNVDLTSFVCVRECVSKIIAKNRKMEFIKIPFAFHSDNQSHTGIFIDFFSVCFVFLILKREKKTNQINVTKFVMPCLTRLLAACKRPSRVRNAAHRAEPMTVPLYNKKYK